MGYVVKEVFYTLQGEGARSGRAAVFCRFAGCNLWSGREADRADARCTFCDTDFVGTDGPGGGRFATAELLARHIAHTWDGEGGGRYVVFTGGEPALQLDEALVAALHARGFEIAIETNGTVPLPDGIDWVTVSPKVLDDTVVRRGDELKLVQPQAAILPDDVAGWPFQHYFLQPKDGPAKESALRDAVAYCRAHPQWRLSLQTHKLIGIP